MSDNKKRKKRELSPATRDKLSRLAKERVANGEMGGAKFGKLGGRPKQQRVAERIASAAQEEENAHEIIAVLKDAIHKTQPMHVRLRAVDAWVGIEREEGKLSLQEREYQSREMGREELIEVLSKKLTSGSAAQILRQQIEQNNPVDAEVVEDEDE